VLHLVYRFRPTANARGDLAGFWQWIADRQQWFYSGLDMVLDTKWYTVTIGDDVHCLEHHVTFADEAAWGNYRREVSRRSQHRDWEERRTSQDQWYEIIDARILNDPPISISLPVSEQPHRMSDSDAAELVRRSRILLKQARYVTVASDGRGGPWAATVNYVALTRPLRLIWYSLCNARHSTNIATRPRVAGSVFRTGLTDNDSPSGIPIDGAQLLGACREVPAEELEIYYQHYYEMNFPDPAVRAAWQIPIEEFRGDGPRRFYCLNIDRWWLFDAQRWSVDKHDTRIEVPVTNLDVD
jgi:uncharacterized protein YhbP (UPF0306 family)